jgi:alpha-beta hydrolase superfamily lysophospholipase
MRLTFTTILTTDKLELPTLIYTPDTTTRKAAVWLHGMGDNGSFYNPSRINALGHALTEKGIAFMALNNRGAHNFKRLKIADEMLPEEDRTYMGGTYNELIADCVHDIDGAAGWLKQSGYSELYLIGHSSGANKICVYDDIKKQTSPFRKYVLAGPGDDTGMFFEDFGSKRFWNALQYAASQLKDTPLKPMPKYTGMWPFSVQSSWDILNPDGRYNTFPYYEAQHERLGSKPLFDEFSRVQVPTHILIGSEDEYMSTAGSPQQALDLFMKHTPDAMIKHHDYTLLQGASHSFTGYEESFAKAIADWLAHE